jgi:C_GCAxxG_C_C family probable redox protein
MQDKRETQTEGRRFMNPEEEAKLSFNSGYNCAESVSMAVSKQIGRMGLISRSCIPRIATGFGGGVGRNGDICGALAGGVIAIGLASGRDNSDQSRDPCYHAVDRFYNEFVETFGSSRCRNLTGLDLKKPEQREVHKNRIHAERCSPIVAWAAKRAYEIIREAKYRPTPSRLITKQKPTVKHKSLRAHVRAGNA